MEKLYQIANEEHICIDYHPMKKLSAFSLSRTIVIDPSKIRSRRKLKECLAHEIGHHKRNAFYKISSSLETKEWQEERATRWAVQELIPAQDLKEALRQGYTEIWQLAEYFDVSEEFMSEAVRVHTVKGNI